MELEACPRLISECTHFGKTGWSSARYVEVDGAGAVLGAGLVREVAGATDLTALALTRFTLDDASIGALAELGGLCALCLDKCVVDGVSKEALGAWMGAHQLQEMWLHGCGDASVGWLAACTS